MMIKHPKEAPIMNFLLRLLDFFGWLTERHDHDARFRAIVAEHEELLRNG
jgi:hypothetical protein